MDQYNLKQRLDRVAAGDRQAREELIEHYRGFVKKEAQRVCRRYLEWGRDEELSIALMAFNEAIDDYRESKTASLESFARMVIRRRLVDYFRKSDTRTVLTGEQALLQTPVEEDWEQSERVEEVKRYRGLLESFGLTLKQVARAQPKYQETRKRLRNVAKIMAGNEELMKLLYQSRKLPKKRLCEMAGVTSRMLDRGRAYVVALALLLSHEDLPLLQGYALELVGKGEEGYEKSKGNSAGDS